jgi:DNA repair protein RecN (Recombination protein N)
VEFLLAPNPGIPARSLARTASGGELSRTLLAIKAALAGVEGPETLVFDEIDAGIGGRTATAVGHKLRELSRTTQMVVVTHLPQVAAFADHHVLIEKVSGSGLTTTALRALDDGEMVEELCRMLGAAPDDPGARSHARALKDKARAGLID